MEPAKDAQNRDKVPQSLRRLFPKRPPFRLIEFAKPLARNAHAQECDLFDAYLFGGLDDDVVVKTGLKKGFPRRHSHSPSPWPLDNPVLDVPPFDTQST